MRNQKWNSFIALGVLIAVVLGCNFSASTASISGVKLGTDKEAKNETTHFKSSDTVYAVADISGISKVKVKGRVLFDSVEGHKAGDAIPGAEAEVDLSSGGTATFNFSIPGNGWPEGSYKIEISMLNENGEQKDQKTVTFDVK
jgi:Tol biopolymer transport system component